MRWALVNADGLVTNVIIWDGQTEYTPAAGIRMVQVAQGVPCGPGWTYDGTTFTAPPVEPDDE